MTNYQVLALVMGMYASAIRIKDGPTVIGALHVYGAFAALAADYLRHAL